MNRRGLTLPLFLVLLLIAFTAPSGAQSERPYRILITNDDGVHAPGLVALVDALRSLGEITVVAPAENQNAKSHSLTMVDPIYVDDASIPGARAAFAVVATPATCVKLALSSLLPQPPDLVISGINPGYNTGMVVYISGTVGAAREAALQGVPAISVSLNRTGTADFSGAAAVTLEIATAVRQHGLPRGAFLNVAVPAGSRQSFKGIRVTRQSALSGAERFDEQKTPNGRRFFWDVYSDADPGRAEAGTDVAALSEGYVSVTPLKAGEFNGELFEELKSLKIEH